MQLVQQREETYRKVILVELHHSRIIPDQVIFGRGLELEQLQSSMLVLLE